VIDEALLDAQWVDTKGARRTLSCHWWEQEKEFFGKLA